MFHNSLCVRQETQLVLAHLFLCLRFVHAKYDPTCVKGAPADLPKRNQTHDTGYNRMIGNYPKSPFFILEPKVRMYNDRQARALRSTPEESQPNR